MGVLRILFSSVSCVLGWSSLVAFLILNNYPAAVLGFTSGTLDAILVFLHFLEYKGILFQWYERVDLRRFCRLGIFVSGLGILCIGYFATIQIMLNKPMLPIPESGVIPLVWSIVVLRSGTFLIYYSLKYQLAYDEYSNRILNSDEQA
ncbi:unnamed protein product [Phyllotreta striolata]|uniref:Uncharacterized protein n=1 Tax=Phyllotreta striolata TaxID=444603 RepID=A0A9N9TPM0_PHYSR|nr:unnamed protein product [Phyllotreta striolata]